MDSIALGLHKDNWHDTGAAIVATDTCGIRRIVHVNQERLDRKKQSRAFPEEATFACLKELGIQDVDDVDACVLDHTMNGEDWRLDYRNNPCRTDVFLERLDPKKLKLSSIILLMLQLVSLPARFKEAAILIVDGRGSKVGGPDTGFETQSLWRGNETEIELIEISDCCGIGLLYEAVSQAIGFGFLESGKTMGLSPFGRDIDEPVLDLRTSFDGLRTDYGHICDIDNTFLAPLPNMTKKRRRKLAHEVQVECERAVLHLARVASERTGIRNLCLSGGVALNGVANGKLRDSGLFENIFINPACSDSGIALGAALWGYHVELGCSRDYRPVSPYTGPTYSSATIESAINGRGFKVYRDSLLERAASMLRDNKVVALFQGRSEMGPRALGNRSILANPFLAANRDHLNEIIKRREPFRPFAPVVPLSAANEYFDLDCESPFMLFIVDVRSDWRTKLAAVTHVDGTARPQTVTEAQNPMLHQLLTKFGELTGVPVLLNTSFNIAGEPLVETPEDAFQCFQAAGIDALLFPDSIVVRMDEP